MARILAFAVALAMCVAYVSAHGVLIYPFSRAIEAAQAPLYRFAAGYNGGGPKVVGKGNTVRWPHGSPGSMCGDAPGSWEQMAYGGIKAEFKAGQKIPVQFIIWNWHDGRIDNWVCRKGSTKINTKNCVQLKRSDGKSRYFYTPRLDGPENAKAYPQTDWDQSKNPMTWYRYKSDNMFNNAVVLNVKFTLPKNFKCPGGCIFVWRWVTRTTCIPMPCDKADPYYKNGCQPWGRALKKCTDWNSEYPEEFWNCADIKIK